jgi:hypothetical protein
MSSAKVPPSRLEKAPIVALFGASSVRVMLDRAGASGGVRRRDAALLQDAQVALKGDEFSRRFP